MGDGWETARNPTRPHVLEADGQGILQVGATTSTTASTITTTSTTTRCQGVSGQPSGWASPGQ